jgi:C1A family cysteine protease
MKSLLFLAVIVLAAAFTEQEYQDAFTNWMLKYEKSYAPEEFFYKYGVFKTNMDFVDRTNKANLTYTVALNMFADLTSAEFKAIYLGYKPELRRDKKVQVTLSDLKAPETYPNGALDWTTMGAVTPVKNQGQCGSCWAFSTTGNMEGTIAIMYGSLISLSEQMLVDCSWSYGNLGCSGGLMDNAFKYCETNGLCTEAAYPYTAKDGVCTSSKCTPSAHTHLKTYTDVAHNENSLGAAVDIEPVSVAIEADQPAFQMYSSGVFSAPCGQNLDHGVLVVGYGTSGTTPYWKVKNSWGTSWGEAGYILMIRNQDECGIANEPSYSTAGST